MLIFSRKAPHLTAAPFFYMEITFLFIHLKLFGKSGLFLLFLNLYLTVLSALDLSFDRSNELSKILRTFISQETASYRNFALFLFFGTNNQHIRNLLKSCLTDLVTDFLSTGINFDTNTSLFQLVYNLF